MDYTSLPADDLVKACLTTGSSGAWNEFVRRFEKLIATVALRTARRWGEPAPQLIEDLVQETYLKLCVDDARLLRSFDSRHEGAIYGYLKIVTANLVHDHFKAVRSQKRGGSVEQASADCIEEAPGKSGASSTDFEREILIQEIDGCLRALSEGANAVRDRRIFWLYYRTGLSANAIAALPTIGLSTKGVESTLLRLGRQVRERLLSNTRRTTASESAEAGDQRARPL